MKHKKIVAVASVLMVLMSTGVVIAATQSPESRGNQNGFGNNGSGTCNTSSQSTLTDEDQVTEAQTSSIVDTENLETMLTSAIYDEYKAKAEYDALIDAFGSIRPFSNIVKAEANHIDALEILFETYHIKVPADNGAEFVVVPDTVFEALEAGTQAETSNIAMYEEFLKQRLPQDVAYTFTALMNASQNHLAAFEQNLERIN